MLTVDQRGSDREDPNGFPDIGAYELSVPSIAVMDTYFDYSSGTKSIKTHSRVNRLVITFDQDVTFASNNPTAAISMSQTRTGLGTPTGSLTISATQIASNMVK